MYLRKLCGIADRQGICGYKLFVVLPSCIVFTRNRGNSNDRYVFSDYVELINSLPCVKMFGPLPDYNELTTA